MSVLLCLSTVLKIQSASALNRPNAEELRSLYELSELTGPSTLFGGISHGGDLI